MAKSLPFNAEAEMSVLGVAFISKDQVDKICESVNEDMFFDEKNKCLFNAIKSLHDQKIPIDITTIKNELDNFHKKQKIGKKNISTTLKNPIERINTLIMQKTKSKSNMSNYSTNKNEESSSPIIAENLSGENHINSPHTETQNEQVSEMIENE